MPGVRTSVESLRLETNLRNHEILRTRAGYYLVLVRIYGVHTCIIYENSAYDRSCTAVNQYLV